jgi:hypothetical protein
MQFVYNENLRKRNEIKLNRNKKKEYFSCEFSLRFFFVIGFALNKESMTTQQEDLWIIVYRKKIKGTKNL